MSENLDLVRSIYADWERGDYSSVEWADPDIEFVRGDGPDPVTVGLSEIAQTWGNVLSAWEGFRIAAEDYRELDAHRVLVITRYGGRGRASGLDVAQMSAVGATVFHVRDCKVTRQIFYFDRDCAFADLGLEE
jgi:ketosteroid isomerase-like protein